MGAPKYAKRTDGNHKEITAALRPHVMRIADLDGDDGDRLALWTIHLPVDVMCWSRRGDVVLFEIKDPSKYTTKERSDQAHQWKMLRYAAAFAIHCYRVESPDEAVRVMEWINDHKSPQSIHKLMERDGWMN